jgi:hypothetical protein
MIRRCAQRLYNSKIKRHHINRFCPFRAWDVYAHSFEAMPQPIMLTGLSASWEKRDNRKIALCRDSTDNKFPATIVQSLHGAIQRISHNNRKIAP